MGVLSLITGISPIVNTIGVHSSSLPNFGAKNEFGLMNLLYYPSLLRGGSSDSWLKISHNLASPLLSECFIVYFYPPGDEFMCSPG